MAACRKRRIKCGEERPTCKNCVKSKRECEGYIPRVIFKDPLSAFRPAQQGIAARTQEPSLYDGNAGIYGGISNSADVPINPNFQPHGEPNGHGQIFAGNGATRATSGEFYGTAGYVYGLPNPMNDLAFAQQYLPQTDYTQPPSQNGNKTEKFDSISYPGVPSFQHQTTGESDGGIEMAPPDLPHGWSNGSDSSGGLSADFLPAFAQNPSGSCSTQVRRNYQGVEPPGNHFAEREPSIPSQPPSSFPRLNSRAIQEAINFQIQTHNQHYGFRAQATWASEPEDEYYDVDSDEEDSSMKPHIGDTPSHNLGPLIAMSASQDDGHIRSMTGFLNEPNVLATYQPSYSVSPLMDSRTARVFCHFITATAPTLAVCERHPSNPAIIFSGVPVPKSQRSLWSYILPMMALRHQGLLHAMLALASLHISKLQQSSPTPSLRHYHFALRRVAKALGNEKKRRDVATLAATLLLGFYEVTTAEHNKWNSHLSGARELIMDIDFPRTAKRIETQRCRQEEAESRHQLHHGMTNGYVQLHSRRLSDDFPSKYDRQLDETLISTIMGYQTNFNQYGQIIDEDKPIEKSETPLMPQDIENFEVQCDLFWWYAKQDIYQSIISGNRLLYGPMFSVPMATLADSDRLSYDRWSQCPPRAPIGRLDAVFGSLDHVLLLMGRVANFAGNDRPRKMRVHRERERAAQQQRSASQSEASGTPMRQGPPQTPSTQQPSPMYGYMPNPGQIRVPRGFDQAKHDRLYTAPVPSADKSLEIATCEAEAEWAAISHAFDVYFESLGPDYAPLSPEHMSPASTPFGPALYYRSYSIACVLVMYYCGRIILERSKPSMPPVAMAAVGMAAPSTAQYAITIGRICAGIQPIDSSVSLNPHHGAALMDSCMGLFHAGVQYREQGQRGWTVTKLRDVARLTGWQTSALIASGCETAWFKAAEAGKGPPYTRTMNSNSKDDRVAGRGRDPKSFEHPPKDNNDRRFITVNAGTRVYWAIGLLGVEEDMKNMNIT